MICTVKHLDHMLPMKYAISAKGKQWKVGEVIDIKFLDGTAEQRKFVIETAKEWTKYANISFKYDQNAKESDVRISFRKGQGAWSYVGTDALFIPQNQPTMNLGWLDEATVLHEYGHMLSLLHEHQNPKGGIRWNEEAVIKSLSGPPNNWDLNTIRRNVLDKEHPSTINGTQFDPESIMLYYFPKEWTLNTDGTDANRKLSFTDIKHIQELYPFFERNGTPTYNRGCLFFGSGGTANLDLPDNLTSS